MEFHRLHALVHDRVSSFMRRMDREYVGLHVRRRCILHSILPRYRSDRQSSREYRTRPTQSNGLSDYRKNSSPKQVLNLFLALLLSNFGSSSLSAPTADQETNKIAEAFNRISRFKKWVKSSIMNGLKKIKNKITNQISVQPSGNDESWLCLCVVYLRIEWLMVFFFRNWDNQCGNIRDSQFYCYLLSRKFCGPFWFFCCITWDVFELTGKLNSFFIIN